METLNHQSSLNPVWSRYQSDYHSKFRELAQNISTISNRHLEKQLGIWNNFMQHFSHTLKNKLEGSRITLNIFNNFSVVSEFGGSAANGAYLMGETVEIILIINYASPIHYAKSHDPNNVIGFDSVQAIYDVFVDAISYTYLTFETYTFYATRVVENMLESKFQLDSFSYTVKVAMQCTNGNYLFLYNPKSTHRQFKSHIPRVPMCYIEIVRLCKLLAFAWNSNHQDKIPALVFESIASSLLQTQPQLPNINVWDVFMSEFRTALEKHSLPSVHDPSQNLLGHLVPSTIREMLEWLASTISRNSSPKELYNYLWKLWTSVLVSVQKDQPNTPSLKRELDNSEQPPEQNQSLKRPKKSRKSYQPQQKLTIVDLPESTLDLFENQEELDQFLKLYNSSEQAVAERVQTEIQKLKKSTDMKCNYLMYYRSRSDAFCVPMDTRPQAFHNFGVDFLQRVNTKKGLATVLGTFNGCLFFQLDNDPGASYWDNVSSFEDMLSMGVTIASDQTPHDETLKKVAIALVNTSQLALLSLTSLIYWVDVVSTDDTSVQILQESMQCFFGRCQACYESYVNHKVCPKEIHKLLEFFTDTKSGKYMALRSQQSGFFVPVPDAKIHSYYQTKLLKPLQTFPKPSLVEPMSTNIFMPRKTPVKNQTSEELFACPWCSAEFPACNINEHANLCIADKLKHVASKPPETKTDLPDLNIDDSYFPLKSVYPNPYGIIHNRSQILPLLTMCVNKVEELGPLYIKRAFMMFQNIEIEPNAQTKLEDLYLGTVIKPNIDRLSIDEWARLPKKKQELLMLDRLKENPKMLSTLPALGKFVNLNLALDNQSVMKVLQKMLSTEVLISLFEVASITEDLLDCDYLKEYIVNNLNLLHLQDSKKFSEMNKDLQNVLLKCCTEVSVQMQECNNQPPSLQDDFDLWDEADMIPSDEEEVEEEDDDNFEEE